jgi:hypothetical protein
VRGERKSSRVKKASESAFVWRREKRGERDEESRLGYE